MRKKFDSEKLMNLIEEVKAAGKHPLNIILDLHISRRLTPYERMMFNFAYSKEKADMKLIFDDKYFYSAFTLIDHFYNSVCGTPKQFELWYSLLSTEEKEAIVGKELLSGLLYMSKRGYTLYMYEYYYYIIKGVERGV